MAGRSKIAVGNESTSFSHHFLSRSNTIATVESGAVSQLRQRVTSPTTQDDMALSLSDSKNRRSLNLEIYWDECELIKDALPEGEEVDDREAEEAEEAIDREWLKNAGLPRLAAKFEEKKEVSLDEVEMASSALSMTDLQAAAVVRRVTRLNATVKKWKSQTQFSSGGEVENAQLPTIDEPEQPKLLQSGLDQSSDDSEYLVLLQPVPETQPGEPAPLPSFGFRYDPTGLSTLDDFGEMDHIKLRHIALLELTAILDMYNIPVRTGRSPLKRKSSLNDKSIVGAPLTLLVEREGRKKRFTKAPLFLKQMCKQLEENGLDIEGIYRIPGNSSRLKRMRDELDSQFYEGKFSWEGRATNDLATLLKQFLRELPVPLLTFEYLGMFAACEAIPERKAQLKALNLLILLLPDVNRKTLELLLEHLNRVVAHEEKNRMGLNNVAMIIAPNLFCQLGKTGRNAENQVKFAAGTSHVVRLLIKYADLLFVVPSYLIHQLRVLYETEKNTNRKSKNKVMSFFSHMNKKMVADSNLMSPTKKSKGKTDSDLLSEGDRSVIKVLSPQFSKISMALEILEGMTTADVIMHFRSKQLAISPASSTASLCDIDCHGSPSDTFDNPSQLAKSMGAIQEQGQSKLNDQESPASLKSETNFNVQEEPAPVLMKSGSHHEVVSAPEQRRTNMKLRKVKSYAPPATLRDNDLFSAWDEQLYEVNGNIGERRLPPNAVIMEVKRANPGATWVMRSKSLPRSKT